MKQTQVAQAAERYEEVWSALRSQIDEIRLNQRSSRDRYHRADRAGRSPSPSRHISGRITKKAGKVTSSGSGNGPAADIYDNAAYFNESDEYESSNLRGRTSKGINNNLRNGVSERQLVERLERLGKQMNADRKSNNQQQKFIAELIQHFLQDLHENQNQQATAQNSTNSAHASGGVQTNIDGDRFSGKGMINAAGEILPRMMQTAASGAAAAESQSQESKVDLTNESRREWVRTSILQIGASMRTFEALQACVGPLPDLQQYIASFLSSKDDHPTSPMMSSSSPEARFQSPRSRPISPSKFSSSRLQHHNGSADADEGHFIRRKKGKQHDESEAEDDRPHVQAPLYAETVQISKQTAASPQRLKKSEAGSPTAQAAESSVVPQAARSVSKSPAAKSGKSSGKGDSSRAQPPRSPMSDRQAVD